MSRKYQAISLGNLVIQKCPDKISGDFEKNKDLVSKILFYESQLEPEVIGILEGQYDAKRLRNEVAGHITHTYKNMQKHGQGYDMHGNHEAGKKKKRIGRYFRKQR